MAGPIITNSRRWWKNRTFPGTLQSTGIRNTGFRTGIPGWTGERGFCGRAAVLRLDSDLDDSVGVRGEEAVGLLDAAEGEAVGDERCGVETAVGDEAEDFLTLTA